MKPFFNVISVEAVHALAAELEPLAGEEVSLAAAAGRTLASPLAAPHDLPGFTRSCMDGYALQARDTFGASELNPAYLELVGEVPMGTVPAFSLGSGQCALIFTGGMLPAGADAVQMVEHTRLLGADAVEVAQAVAPGANLLGPRDDAAAGQELLLDGHCLRAQDLGLMASLGVGTALVRREPRVGIISTGDEVVPVETMPGPGQVRDVNSYTLATLAQEAGARALTYGLVGDVSADLKETVARASRECDLVLLSGGSSVGTRDLTAEVFMEFDLAQLMVHGVAVSPGKPFIWVRAGNRHLIGLPGQVASCVVAFYVLVEPVIERLLGRQARPFRRFVRQRGVLKQNLPSTPGREDYFRVIAGRNGQGWEVEPVFGKSGLITTLVRGNGLLRIPSTSEGLYQGDEVEVLLFP